VIPTELSLRDAYGANLDASVRVRARRPGAVFQVELPAFSSDGDVAPIFVRPGANEGEVVVTDLGTTRMRLSYHRTNPAEEERALARLAEAQGLRFEGGELCTPVAWSDLVAATLGLLQVEAQAESLFKTARIQRKRAARFRAAAHAIVVSVFGEAVQRDYVDENDSTGLYRVDAYVPASPTVRRPLAVSFVPGDVEAERAVATKHALLHMGWGGAPSVRWVAIPRDLERLRSATRRRVVNEFDVACDAFDANEAALADRLRDYAA
jgi:hypothetical protein